MFNYIPVDGAEPKVGAAVFELEAPPNWKTLACEGCWVFEPAAPLLPPPNVNKLEDCAGWAGFVFEAGFELPPPKLKVELLAAGSLPKVGLGCEAPPNVGLG